MIHIYLADIDIDAITQLYNTPPRHAIVINAASAIVIIRCAFRYGAFISGFKAPISRAMLALPIRAPSLPATKAALTQWHSPRITTAPPMSRFHAYAAPLYRALATADTPKVAPAKRKGYFLAY